MSQPAGSTGRVAGKRIVITGAGSGIGRAFALGLARQGAVVGVLDLNEAAAQSVTAEIADEGNDALALTADVSHRAEVVDALDSFVATAGPLDVMFNNAARNRPMPLLEVTEEAWNAIMNVNALGTLIGIQEAAQRMIPQRSGKIINTTSIAGRQGYPTFVPYCASKFAINALTQAAARGLAEHNITCNAFAPGVVNTPLWTQVDADLTALGGSGTPGETKDDFSTVILRGHPAAPEELVGTALFLASEDSDYLTGQVIMIDGGILLV